MNELFIDRGSLFVDLTGLRLMAIGRNQYIDIMNQCRSSRVSWDLCEMLSFVISLSCVLDSTDSMLWLSCAVLTHCITIMISSVLDS